MNDRDRVDHLRALLDRLERIPASADRDWMLAQVRGRAVDVDTGTSPAPMRALPQDELAAENAADRSARSAPVRTYQRKSRRARPVHPPARIQPGPARERGHEEVMDLLERGGMLSLDDSPAAPAGASRPWSRGLRG
jgi:hypothetical protein